MIGWSHAVLPLVQMSERMHRGYTWMFLLLASTPYVLLVVIGGGLYRARKREIQREVERQLAEQNAWEAGEST
jgi:hypothetical protein